MMSKDRNRVTRATLSWWLPSGVMWGGVIWGGVLGGSVKAQEDASMTAPQVFAVSEPPAPVLPGDPPTGLIFRLPHDLSSAAPTFDVSDRAGEPLSLEYLRFDAAGNGYATFHDGSDAPGSGGVLFIDDFSAREGETFDASRDHLVTGVKAGLAGPRDLALASDLSIVVVADFADADIKVLELDAEGDTVPLFVTTELGKTAAGDPRNPWGLTFDSVRNRLFVAATDGTVLVYDHYLVNQGRAGPDRIITPTVEETKASANLHGVSYLADRDTLILLDVGEATTTDEPGFDADGKLFVLEDASTAEGDTEVKSQISGPASLLGNPVGLAFDGNNLYVAEKARDVVLRFGGVLELTGVTDLAPSGAVTVTAPESVVLARD